MIRSIKISDSDWMLSISVNAKKSTFYPGMSVSVWFFAFFVHSEFLLSERVRSLPLTGAKTPFTYGLRSRSPEPKILDSRRINRQPAERYKAEPKVISLLHYTT